MSAVVGKVTTIAAGAKPVIRAPEQSEHDVAYWRQLATDTKDRLKIAESQAKDLREAADESRARMTKYKQRLESAQEQVTALQVKLVEVSAERDRLRETVPDVARIQRKLFEYRQSLLDGPLFELLGEFCREVAVETAADGGAS